jgi:hypothetical protein
MERLREPATGRRALAVTWLSLLACTALACESTRVDAELPGSDLIPAPDAGTSEEALREYPGEGAVTACSTFVARNGNRFERVWRGGQIYWRANPEQDWSPDTTTYPGAGETRAFYEYIVPARTLEQGIWRGGVEFRRSIPIAADGIPDWQNAEGWQHVSGESLPGVGLVQAEAAYVSEVEGRLVQLLWQANSGYVRRVPFDESGRPLWNAEGSGWQVLHEEGTPSGSEPILAGCAVDETNSQHQHEVVRGGKRYRRELSYWRASLDWDNAADWIVEDLGEVSFPPPPDQILGLDFESPLASSAAANFLADENTTTVVGYTGAGASMKGPARIEFASKTSDLAEAGTIMLWFKPEWPQTSNSYETHILFHVGLFGGVLLMEDSNYNLRAIINRESPEGYPELDVFYPAPPDPAYRDVWHHLAVTWDDSNLALYVNGELIDEKQVTMPLFPFENIIGVGCGHRGRGELGAEGTLDMVDVRDRALSPDEIREVYLLTK